MSEVQDHYENLLAKHYTWMFGTTFQVKVAEQKAILEDALQAHVSHTGLAVDLGCGPGFQTLALAELGYSPVLAVDTSEALLEEVASHIRGCPVRTVQGDLLKLDDLVKPGTARVVVCMGDTITHLESRASVVQLIQLVFTAIVPGGHFVISYRDLSPEPPGLDRFIPVQADDRKIMTCFLEFDRPDAVLVHDLIYTRQDHGWLFEKSAYRKLRLPVAWLTGAMGEAGFVVQRGDAGRLVCLVGRKPLNRG